MPHAMRDAASPSRTIWCAFRSDPSVTVYVCLLTSDYCEVNPFLTFARVLSMGMVDVTGLMIASRSSSWS
jgi:hypothetical protein